MFSFEDDDLGSTFHRSAGASLRRYNEAALEMEIQELVALWSPHVLQATAIFTRNPRHNQSLFTGGRKSPLARDDPRIRRIPFSTRRPTFREVKRVHSCLATLYIGGVASPAVMATIDTTKATPKDGSVPQSVERKERGEEREGEEEGVRGGGSEGDIESGEGGGDSGVDEEMNVGRKKRKAKSRRKKEVDKTHLESE